jgi:hypothetical protein
MLWVKNDFREKISCTPGSNQTLFEVVASRTGRNALCVLWSLPSLNPCGIKPGAECKEGKSNLHGIVHMQRSHTNAIRVLQGSIVP